MLCLRFCSLRTQHDAAQSRVSTADTNAGLFVLQCPPYQMSTAAAHAAWGKLWRRSNKRPMPSMPYCARDMRLGASSTAAVRMHRTLLCDMKADCGTGPRKSARLCRRMEVDQLHRRQSLNRGMNQTTARKHHWQLGVSRVTTTAESSHSAMTAPTTRKWQEVCLSGERKKALNFCC